MRVEPPGPSTALASIPPARLPSAELENVCMSYIHTSPSQCSTLLTVTEKWTKITIAGKVAYEDEITVAQAARIIGFLNADTDAESHLGGSPADAATGLGTSPPGETKVTSPRAALDTSRATTNPQKIVALANYVLQDGGMTFTLEAIKVQFSRARESLPKNLSRDLSSAIAAGLVAETETSGEYYLTREANNILEKGFPTAGRSNSSKARSRTSAGSARKSSAPSKKSKPAIFADIDEFPNVVDNVPPYHQMPTQKDKLLWALWFTKEQDIKGLTNSDAAWLTNELGDGIPSKQITARFNSLRKDGYANRSTADNTLRITPTGEEYLTSINSKRN